MAGLRLSNPYDIERGWFFFGAKPPVPHQAGEGSKRRKRKNDRIDANKLARLRSRVEALSDPLCYYFVAASEKLSMPSVIETARWAAAQRARESERSDRLFSDPLAAALAGEEGLAALELSEKYNPRHADTANYISIRIRFFDDIALDGAVHGIRQIVLPAAGMDARAYRLPWPNGTMFYELDHAELFAIKEKLLGRQSITSKCKRIKIGTDLKQDWARLVVDSGFSANEPSMWIIEGLFYYLEEADVHHVLKQASNLAASGSVLVTDLVSQSLLTSPWMQQALKAMEERGMGWRFGTDDPAALFAQYGWEAEIKRPGEEGTKYNAQRFPNQPGHSMFSFFIVARQTHPELADHPTNVS